MRRVILGVVSFAICLAVLERWENAYLAIGAALGVYAVADWLGLAPSAYESRIRDLLHDDNENHES